MQSYSLLFRKHLNAKLVSELFLGLCWAAGLIFGSCLAAQLPDAVFPMMRMAAQEHVSIVGVVIVTFLPLILSVAALWLSKPVLFMPIAFVKALLYGFSVAMIMYAFRDAGWLVGRLLLFSESIMVVVLLWFWFRNLHKEHIRYKNDILICLIVAATVSLADIYAVSPFLVSLFQHY